MATRKGDTLFQFSDTDLLSAVGPTEPDFSKVLVGVVLQGFIPICRKDRVGTRGLSNAGRIPRVSLPSGSSSPTLLPMRDSPLMGPAGFFHACGSAGFFLARALRMRLRRPAIGHARRNTWRSGSWAERWPRPRSVTDRD
jgi:hypothetical protein